MYKILKRGYYYGNTHKPEEEFLPTSYPTEEMAYYHETVRTNSGS